MSDSYMFVTECLLHFNNGMRQAVQGYLEEVYGEAWWVKGVVGPVSQGWPNADIERVLEYGLDVGLYPLVIKANIDGAFRGIFLNRYEVRRDLRRICIVRNKCAHQQEIEAPLAQRAAGWMRDILKALGRQEATEIAHLLKEFAIESPAVQVEDHTGDLVTTMYTDDISLVVELKVPTPEDPNKAVLRLSLTCPTPRRMIAAGRRLITSTSPFWPGAGLRTDGASG